MKKTHFANIVAVGVGMVSMTAHADTNIESVFNVNPREVHLQVCETNAISLSNINQMIGQRNIRDYVILRSCADNMTHL